MRSSRRLGGCASARATRRGHRWGRCTPPSDDPSRQARLDRLTDLLASHPDHEGLREALVTALADAGEPDRGRVFLEGWPAAMRDARYWRLRGRWDLEYDHRPDQAIPAFRAALEVLPHDWRTQPSTRRIE